MFRYPDIPCGAAPSACRGSFAALAWRAVPRHARHDVRRHVARIADWDCELGPRAAPAPTVFSRNPDAMKPNLPSLLTFNGGYVDTAGFLALQGLFTAHVTGNFVTLGATLVAGSTGAIAKLLALPVFCGVVLAAGVARRLMLRAHAPALKILLGAQWLLLVAGAALAIRLGPFANGDAWPAIATGMALVMAMAIQNAVHRLHLPDALPTTLMTGTVTQLMLHLSERIAGDAVPVRGSPARLANMAWTVVTFALGCAAAALAYLLGGAWAFALPPVLIAFALFLCDERKLEHAL